MAKKNNQDLSVIAHSNLFKRLVSSLNREKLLNQDSNLELIGSTNPFSRDLAKAKYTKSQASTEFNNAVELLNYIKADLIEELADDFSEKNWDNFILEVENCIENDILFLDYRLKQEASLTNDLKQGFWSWLESKRTIDLEHISAVGHPIHPGYKVKFGFSQEELVNYAPEFEPSHDLFFLALHKSIAKINSAQKDFDYKSQLEKDFPGLLKKWSQDLEEQGFNPEDYVPIPIHPWQKDHTLISKFNKIIESGKLIILENTKIKVSPTLSLRTLEPVDYKSCHIKVPISTQMTSAKRSIPPSNVHNGPLFSDYTLKVIAKENHFDKQFDFVNDQYGIILEPCEEIEYDDTRNLCAIFRTNPINLTAKDEVLIPLAFLFVDSPLTNKPFVLDIIKESEGDLSKDTITKFFEKYLSLIFATQLELYLKYGIALEAHQQNSFLVFKSGKLEKLIVRDSSDIEFYEKQLDQTKLNYQVHFKTYQIKESRETCRQTLIHTMFYSNILFLVKTLNEFIPSEELLTLLKGKLQSSFAKAKIYMEEDEYKEEYHYLLESEHWQASCLLRMRLAATEKYIAIDNKNPLFNL